MRKLPRVRPRPKFCSRVKTKLAASWFFSPHDFIKLPDMALCPDQFLGNLAPVGQQSRFLLDTAAVNLNPLAG